jgi:hypothetical protein
MNDFEVLRFLFSHTHLTRTSSYDMWMWLDVENPGVQGHDFCLLEKKYPT